MPQPRPAEENSEAPPPAPVSTPAKDPPIVKSDDGNIGQLEVVLPGSISIKMKPVEVPVRSALSEMSSPLTQERLQEAWDSLMEQWESTKPDLYSVLRGHAVRLEESDLFAIEAANSNFERDLRPVQTPMLESLRAHLSRPALRCRVEVRAEQRESKVYQPSEKYEAMLQTNPALAKLRTIFGELDY